MVGTPKPKQIISSHTIYNMQDIIAAAAVLSSAAKVGWTPNNVFYPYPRPRKKPPMTNQQIKARAATKRQRQARKKGKK